MDIPKVSVVIPVFNEERAVEKVINSVKQVIKNLKGIKEIIVVNDGSTDSTADVLDRINGIRLIHHNYNKGYGASLKTGIKEAVGDWIFITDADGTYPINEIPLLLQHINNYDMVIGKRSKDNVNIPLLRRPAKYFLNNLASFLAGKHIPDLNSGFRLFNKEKCLEFWKLYPSRFSFTSTISMGFYSKGYRIKYIPINYFKRKGESSISPFDFYNFNNLLLRLTLLFNPIKIFTLVSALLVLFATLVGVYSIYYVGEFMDVTVVLLGLSALQIFLFGLIAHIVVRYK